MSALFFTRKASMYQFVDPHMWYQRIMTLLSLAAFMCFLVKLFGGQENVVIPCYVCCLTMGTMLALEKKFFGKRYCPLL